MFKLIFFNSKKALTVQTGTVIAPLPVKIVVFWMRKTANVFVRLDGMV